MNRSFRASPGVRPAAAAAAKDANASKEDDLALFLEMRKRDNLLLLHSSDDLEPPPPGSKPGSSPLFKIVSTAAAPPRRTGMDDFLNSEGEKNDYDWLLTPPGTPLFPSLEKESSRSPSAGHTATPKARQAVLRSRLANPADTSSRSNLASRQATSSSSLNSYGIGTRRPTSSGGLSTASRPSTPTGRPTLSATSRPARPSTPTSRATLPSKPTVPAKPVVPPPRSLTPARSSILTSTRSSVPTSTRSSVPTSTRSAAPALTRSSAPSAARSSTPTSRSSLSAPNKPASRSATPTRRNSAPSSLPASSAPPGRSSSITKSGPTISKSSAPSRGTSPTIRSRPWKPSDMPGFSLDAPPNLRTSMPERPSSASRGRPGAPSSRSSSVDPEPNVRPRRQSCSPSRGRAPNGIAHSGSSVPAVNRLRLNGGDSVSPVLIGNKMVERVINMRRLAPPKQDDQRSSTNSLTGKSSNSPDSTGFGRTLSRKSLDMAMRHMDIRRSIPNNLRPLMTNIPASSMYSVRSGPTRSRPVSVSDSPLATSSNASSEQSFSNNIPCLSGSEIEDDLYSDKGGRSSLAGPLAR